MAAFVSLVGLALILVGIFGIVQPTSTRRHRPSLAGARPLSHPGRLVVGIAFIFAAPATRFPTVVLVMGVAAVALMLAGSKRVDALIQWWFRQSAGFTRGWCILAVLVGVALVYAGV